MENMQCIWRKVCLGEELFPRNLVSLCDVTQH